MIGEDNTWIVYWNDYTADTYLYGSEIEFHSKDNIEFHNDRMPAGTVIKRWYSKTQFQAQRIEPSLPIIDGENRYELIIDMDVPENELFLFRIVFYDKYELEAGFVNIRDIVTEFKCPLKTYSYQIELINGGLSHFNFHKMIIRDITDESEEYTAKTE